MLPRRLFGQLDFVLRRDAARRVRNQVKENHRWKLALELSDQFSVFRFIS